MTGPDWLTARPVAHRGLHGPESGIVENTPSAFAAAVAGNYAIECDLQISADGEAMVHHDDKLGRLTQGSGRLDAMSAVDLKRVPFLATADRMITLGELCDLVAGRVTLVIELKSRFDGDHRVGGQDVGTLQLLVDAHLCQCGLGFGARKPHRAGARQLAAFRRFVDVGGAQRVGFDAGLVDQRQPARRTRSQDEFWAADHLSRQII